MGHLGITECAAMNLLGCFYMPLSSGLANPSTSIWVDGIPVKRVWPLVDGLLSALHLSHTADVWCTLSMMVCPYGLFLLH